MDWKTYGHEAVVGILDKQLSTQNFSHAYLFSGPEGVGKKTLALEFTKNILQNDRLETHPDFKILDMEGEITIEAARQFMDSLAYKPFIAKKKIAIINNAHNLNTQSSNALLKTLEEPSASTIIILISSGRQLLPTIVSRCQVFNFNLFSTLQLQNFAKTSNVPASSATINLSFGSPSRLKSLTSEKSFFEAEQKSISELEAILKTSPVQRLVNLAKFGELETEDLEKVLRTWTHWHYQSLKNNPERFKTLDFLTKALEQLKTNKNKKLILQGLFLSM